MMRLSIVTMVLALSTFASHGYGQTNSSNVTPGYTIDGSTGLFLNSTPQLLEAGHIRIGLMATRLTSRKSMTQSIPLSAAVGFTRKVELHGARYAWTGRNGLHEEVSLAGLRIWIGSLGPVKAAGEVNYRESLNSESNQPEGRDAVLRSGINLKMKMSGQLLYFNMANIYPVKGNQLIGGWSGGAGYLFPLTQDVHGIIEARSNGAAQYGDWEAFTGLRNFPGKHFQITAGILWQGRTEGALSRKFILQLGFSTKRMTTLPKRISWRNGIVVPPLESFGKYQVEIDNEKVSANGVKRELDPAAAHLPIPPPIESLDDPGYYNLVDENGIPYFRLEELKVEDLPLPPPLPRKKEN